MKRIDSIAIILAFNEEKNIEKVVDDFYPYFSKLIIVDDGSTDSTSSILQNLKYQDIVLIKNEKNLGIGGAFKKGLNRALTFKSKWIFKIDGDGQMRSDDLINFFNHMDNTNSEYIKGNRFTNNITNSSMPKYRVLGNYLSTLLNKISSGYWKIYDSNNGFLAIKSDVIKLFRMEKLKNNYFLENSLLVEANINNIRVSEIPTNTIYEDEVSSIPIIKVVVTLLPTFIIFFYSRMFYKYFYSFSFTFIIFVIFNISTLFFLLDFVQSGLLSYSWMLSSLISIVAVLFLDIKNTSESMR